MIITLSKAIVLAVLLEAYGNPSSGTLAGAQEIVEHCLLAWHLRGLGERSDLYESEEGRGKICRGKICV